MLSARQVCGKSRKENFCDEATVFESKDELVHSTTVRAALIKSVYNQP